MTFSPNRLVALLTPIVFAPLAGSIAVLAARYLPGVDVDQGSLQAIFITGATIAFGKAALWLKGWQDWEKQQADVPGDDVDLPIDHSDIDMAEASDDSGLDGAGVDDDSALDEDLGFDDGDLDELLAAPVGPDSED
jgi:hypothetical protein